MRRRLRFHQVLIILLCVVIAAAIVYLARLSENSQQQQETALQNRAEELKQAEEERKETDSENTEVFSESETETAAVPSAEKKKAVEKITEAVTETPLPDTISCRGDAFWDGISEIEATYPEYLEELLNENDISVQVEDYTWEMAGSLSQMRLAGISEDKINRYIEAHNNREDAASLPLTDQQLRTDMETKNLTRDDYDAIPVVCIGYYGGWGYDLDELIEQEQAILNTYNDREHYLVMGFYPHDWTDTAAYDEIHKKAYGSHYLSLNSQVEGIAMSDSGRKEIAAALYDKLYDLGYLEED